MSSTPIIIDQGVLRASILAYINAWKAGSGPTLTVEQTATLTDEQIAESSAEHLWAALLEHPETLRPVADADPAMLPTSTWELKDAPRTGLVNFSHDDAEQLLAIFGSNGDDIVEVSVGIDGKPAVATRKGSDEIYTFGKPPEEPAPPPGEAQKDEFKFF